MRAQPLDLGADGSLDIRERPERHVERRPVRCREVLAHLHLVGSLEAAAGVTDHDDLVGPEALLADDQERIASSVASPPALRMM